MSSLYEMLVEDAAFLWLSRQSTSAAPNARLADLVALDERLEAHIDTAHIAPEMFWPLALTEVAGDGPGGLFLAVSLALQDASEARWHMLLCPVASDSGTEAPCGGAAAADASLPRASDAACAITAVLAWADRAAARPAIDRLLGASDPLPRAIAIAALGARRADPGEHALTRFARDPDPLPRARAFRTIGQLGRRDFVPDLAAAARAESDPECRFWAAWSAARMGADEPLRVLAEIARGDAPRADAALEMLLRRLPVEPANAFLRDFARRLPRRRRSLIRATGLVGDPLYIPWLIERMAEPETARLAGEALSMITGLDLAYRDLDRDAPEGFEAGPNDDPADENVALDEDEWLPWPDPGRIGAWWSRARERFPAGTPFFLGAPKASADWIAALTDGFQRQRLAAALELALRQPGAPMFEARARGRLQRIQLVRAAAKP